MCAILSAGAARASDVISSDDLTARATSDGTLVVREQLTVKFDGQSRFFERTIPLVSPDRSPRGGHKYLGFRLIKVHGQKGPCYFQIKSGASAAVLRIADTGKNLTGVRQYTIEYLLRRAFDVDDAGVVLPFYIFRDDNPYKVNYLSARLELPQKIPAGKLSGQLDTSDPDAAQAGLQSHVDKSEGLLLLTLNDLPARTDAVFHVDMPANTVDKPSWVQTAGQFVVDWYPLFFLPALSLFALLATWFNFGLRPLAGFQPLKGDAAGFWLSPVELAALLRGRTDKRDLSLTILDLARRGFLQIFAVDQDGHGLALKRRFAFPSELSGDGLQRTIEDEQLAPYEREMLEHLFTIEDGQHPLMIDDFNKVVPRINTSFDSVNKHILDKEIFWGRPGSFGYAACAVGIGMIVLGLIMTSAFAYQPAGPWGLGLVAGGVVSLVMARLMPVYTVRGLKMRASAKAALKAHGIEAGERLPDDQLPFNWHLELSGQNLQTQLPWCNLVGTDESVNQGLASLVQKINDGLSAL